MIKLIWTNDMQKEQEVELEVPIKQLDLSSDGKVILAKTRGSNEITVYEVNSLILSSKRGRETGKKILKEGSNLKEDLKDKFNDFVDILQDKLHKISK